MLGTSESSLRQGFAFGKTLVTPHLRRIKSFEFLGTLNFNFTCSAEVNSACAEILLHKMLVTPDSRRPPLFGKSGGTQHFLIVSTNFKRHILRPQ